MGEREAGRDARSEGAPGTTLLIWIGDLELDESRWEARRAGRAIRVEPLVFRLLLLLGREPERVFSRDALIEALWEGRAVSDSALTRVVSIARGLLRRPGDPDPIRSVYGTGYRLVAPSASRCGSAGAGPGPDRSPDRVAAGRAAGLFVGRLAELRELERAAEALSEGRGGLHFVSGEAGIGKTSLADEAARQSSAQGARAQVGRCAESLGAPSFWPWIQILRAERQLHGEARFRVLAAAGAARLERLLDVERQESSRSSSRALDAPDRFAAFDAVSRYLVRASSEAPLLLVLDDLHRGDRSSLELLRFLAPELARTPLLVIGCYRDVELERRPEPRRLVAEAARAASARFHPLEGLSEADVGAFLDQELRTGPLARILHGKSGGNPLFLTQLIARIEAAPGVDPQVEARNLPAALREVIRLQLDGLSLECRDVLTAASVVGREFDLDLLHLATGLDRTSALAHVGEGLAAGVVQELPDPDRAHFRFAHILVRDSLYDSLETSVRARWHARLADSMEGIHGRSSGPNLTAMAHHARCALPVGSRRRAVELSEYAGVYADEQLAYAEAAAEYRRALDLLEPDADARHRCDLLLALSISLVRAGDRRGAAEPCRAAIALARQLRSADALARAAVALSPGFFSIETARYDEELVALLEEALEASGPQAEIALRVRLLSHLATALYWSDHAERREKLTSEALRLVGSGSDRGTLAYALHARHRALWSPDNIEERVGLATRALGLAVELRDRESILLHRALLITDLTETGDVEALDAEIDRYEALAEELQQLQSLWLAPMFRAMRALMSGRFTEAVALADHFRELGARIGSADAENSWAGHRALAGLETGQGEVGLPLLRAQAVRSPRIVVFRAGSAWVAAEIGRQEEALGDLAGLAPSDFEAIPRDMNWLGTMVFLVMASAELRDPKTSEVLLRLLEPYRDRFALIGHGTMFLGSVSAHLARCAAVVGDRPLAERYFERGREMNERAVAKVWATRAMHDRAIELAHWDDASAATDLLERAGASAQSLGMLHMEKRIGRSLAWVGSGPHRSRISAPVVSRGGRP